MPCRSCKSDDQRSFPSELAIHFPGLEDLGRESVLLYPQLSICLNCGFTEFSIDKDKLQLLGRNKQKRTA